MPVGRLGRAVNSAFSGMTPSLLLAREGLLSQLVPSLVELTFVRFNPLMRNLVRKMGSTRRIVDKERLLGGYCVVCMQPMDCVVGNIGGEVVTLFRRRRRLDRSSIAVQARVILVVGALHETVEVLKSETRRPAIERANGADIP